MIESKKENSAGKILAQISQVLLVFIGVCSSLLSTVMRLDMTFSKGTFIFVLLLFAICIWAILSFLHDIPYGKTMVGVTGGVLILVFLFRFAGILQKGMTIIVNAFLKLVMSYYNMKLELFSYAESMETYSSSYCVTVFLCFVGIVLILLVSMNFYRKRRIYMFLFCTLPFAIMPLFVGRVGFYKENLFYLITLAAVIGTAVAGRAEGTDLIRGKVTVFLAGFVLLAAAISFLIYSPKKYETNYSDMLDTKKTLSAMAEWSGEDIFSWVKAYFSSDALDYGKVGSKDQLEYTGKKLLSIQPTIIGKNSLYLKSFVGEKYEENEWFAFNKSDGYAYFTKEKLKGMGTTADTLTQKLAELMGKNGLEEEAQNALSSEIRIRNVALGRSNKVVPYYTQNQFSYDTTGRIEMNNGSDYKLQYYCIMENRIKEFVNRGNAIQSAEGAVYTSDIDNRAKYLNQAATVNEYANQYYTLVPERIKNETLKDFISWISEKYGNHENMRLQSKIEVIQRYLALSGKFRYTLAPGRTPEGKDSLDYFLNENKKGYCVHFATAATMMLRYLGVPARYAEGLSVDYDKLEKYVEKKEESLDVLDRDAHAWVEVYVNNYGFVPYDFTPGRTDLEHAEEEREAREAENDEMEESTQPDTEEQNQQEEDQALEDDVTDEENPEEEEPEDEVDEEDGEGETEEEGKTEEEEMEFEDIEGNEEEEETPAAAKTEGTGSGAAGKAILFTILKVLLTLILAAAVIWLQRLLRLKYYYAELRKKDMRGKVTKMYLHLKPILSSYQLEYHGEREKEYSEKIKEILSVGDEADMFAHYILQAEFSNELTKEEFSEFKRSYRKISGVMWINLPFYKKLWYQYGAGI